MYIVKQILIINDLSQNSKCNNSLSVQVEKTMEFWLFMNVQKKYCESQVTSDLAVLVGIG